MSTATRLLRTGCVFTLGVITGVLLTSTPNRSDTPTTTQEVEETPDSDKIECPEEGCTDSFDTEHGLSIHQGIKHKDK